MKPGGQEQLAVPPLKQYSLCDVNVVVVGSAVVVVGWSEGALVSEKIVDDCSGTADEISDKWVMAVVTSSGTPVTS